MNSYLVSNVADRKHKKIYEELGEGAVFDLSPSQHGWNDFLSIKENDSLYVINKNLNIPLRYIVTKVLDGVKLDECSELSGKVVSVTDGDVRVVFGKPLDRVDMEYPTFVRQNNIKSPKLDPISNQMRQGFNCVQF
ncbi:MAG: hypothetical protein QNK31_11640 [Porticoccus sp.]|nr:hypothetical protein [Porticoccus sp.]